MCRFIAYMGRPIVIDEILFKPENSLIKQSYDALEMSEPLNGDGFGLGWYNHEIDSEPGLFTSVQPAWNNRNLKFMSRKTRTDAFFAHVRAASKGGVSEYNCHPFKYQHLLFMHNGTIHGFEQIKRKLRQDLSDPIYDWIKGQTDSEHFFALLLNLLEGKKLSSSSEHLATAIREAIAKIEEYMPSKEKAEPSFINGVVSDGKNMVAVRYVSDPTQAARTLYYASGSEYCYKEGHCHMLPAQGQNEAVMIVSEKLTHYRGEWHAIPVNHLLIVDEDLSVREEPIF